MKLLYISILESVYLIFMFHMFKTSIDFNMLASPKGWWLGHLIGDEKGLRICPFGRVAIFALIFILLFRNFGLVISETFMNISLGIIFALSLMNMNAVVYLLPIFIVEYALKISMGASSRT